MQTLWEQNRCKRTSLSWRTPSTESDGTLLVKFGNLCFCVGTAVSYLPEEEVDALICTQWNGDPEQMPEETYEKDDAVQIRVYPDGTWDIEQLS